MKSKRLLAIFLSILLLAGLLTGCGAAPSADGEADSFYNAAGSDNGLSTPEQSAQSSTPENRKMIRTARMDAETEDMDVLLTQIDERVSQLGGYVQDRQVYNGSAYSSSRSRYAELTIRIPVDVMDDFVAQVSENANVTSMNESSEDVTLSYVATESRITALQTEETRLLELLAMAETMEDLLLIESRLTEVRAELEEVTSQLRLYDNLIDYGTIHLSLREVKVYTVVEEDDPSFWQRISEGFSNSMKNLGYGLTELLVFFITRLPYLIPLAVIGLGVLLVIFLSNRRKKRAAKKTSDEHTSE